MKKTKKSIEMTIRKADLAYDLGCKQSHRDFHIRYDWMGDSDALWSMDEFDSRKKGLVAHITTTAHPSVEKAIEEAFLRVEDYVNHPEFLK